MVSTRQRVMAVVTGVALATLAWPAYILGVVLGLWQPLQRPSGVSLSARYVSWIEDGTWFDCVADSRRNVDVCKAWDSNGRVLADGDYRLECQGRAAVGNELRPSSVSSSGGHGHAIYLFGQEGARTRTLVPVTNERQAPCPEVRITYPSPSTSSSNNGPGGEGTAGRPLKVGNPVPPGH
jgi:hypothetical protein